MAGVWLAVFVLTAVTLTTAETIALNHARTELYVYRKRVEFLREELEAQCPEYAVSDPGLERRGLAKDTFLHEASIKVEKNLYNNLLELFIECRLAQQNGGPTTARSQTTLKKVPRATTKKVFRTTQQKKTQPTHPTKATTLRQKTTIKSSSNPCTSPSTVNLTEIWRNDYKHILGKEFRHDDTKLLTETTWFRFTGAAGSQLKNSCPLWYSCGAGAAYWTDATTMPKKVGEILKINVYESWAKGFPSEECKRRKFVSTVMRCSSNKFVYRMDTGLSGGADTVCGMN